LESTLGILTRGGTILGTSRTNPFADGADEVSGVECILGPLGSGWG